MERLLAAALRPCLGCRLFTAAFWGGEVADTPFHQEMGCYIVNTRVGISFCGDTCFYLGKCSKVGLPGFLAGV